MIGRRRQFQRPRIGGYAGTVLGTGGLVAYWRLQETSGSVAHDETGIYDATIAGSPTKAISGPLTGGSNAMGGFSSTDNIQLPSGLLIATTSAITVEFWYKLAASENNSAFVLGNPDSTAKPRIQAHMPYSGTIYWDDGDWSSSGRISVGYPGPSYGNWAHVALVGDVPNGKLRIYWNGSELFESPGTWTPYAGSLTGGCIGYWVNGGATSAAMAEFAIYNVALSAAQVAAHAAAQ